MNMLLSLCLWPVSLMFCYALRRLNTRFSFSRAVLQAPISSAVFLEKVRLTYLTRKMSVCSWKAEFGRLRTLKKDESIR
jgi:hypothetical protein